MRIVINEKKKKKKKKSKKKKGDRCTRIAKRKYDVWPSAYASGAVVKCRQGKIWKGLKEEDESIEEETKDKYGSEVADKNERSRQKSLALAEEQEDLEAKIRKALRDEGGAAGMDALEKHTKASKDEISKVVKNADNIKVHKDGDVILMDSLEESKTDKERMKCNSPRRIRKGEAGHGKKKFVVKACDGGTEKIIRYGDANMEIKKDSPARRKSFRARHNCKNPGSKLKARYWSCKKW